MEINKQLPHNICLLKFKISDFPILIEKLSDMWEQIDVDGEDEIKYIIAQTLYNIGEEERKLIYLFSNEEVSLNDIKDYIKWKE